MSVEQRLAALEARVQVAEDHLAIIRLLNSYGPLADSGESDAAANLWIEGGAYDVVGLARLDVHKEVAAMYDAPTHQGLMAAGSAHLTATPRITVDGDKATALAYSFVIKRDDDIWFVFRAAINFWNLVRTADGWRIAERFNSPIDGSEPPRAMMRRAKD